MVTDPQQSIYLAEFLTLPETKPAQEYINGIIQQKPMPIRVIKNILYCLENGTQILLAI